MNSFLLPQFFVCYRLLPEQLRQQARQAYSLFQQDPHHPREPRLCRVGRGLQPIRHRKEARPRGLSQIRPRTE